MKNNLFRKASIERISSPEQLNDYVRVVTPSVWIILAAILILLAGLGAWGIWGNVESTQKSLLVIEDGVATCYLEAKQLEQIQAGQTLRTEHAQGEILAISQAPVEITEGFNSYAAHLGGLQPGDWYYTASVEIAGGDGAWISDIVIDSIAPISFLLN